MSFLKPPKIGQRPGKKVKNTDDTVTERKGDDGKRKYESERRQRKFVEEWAVEFPWLLQDSPEDHAVLLCKVCREFPSIADRTSSLFSGCQSFRHSTLKAHAESKRHGLCENAQQRARQGSEAPLPAVVRGVLRMEEELRVKMVNTMHVAYYVAKREQPYTEFPHLRALVARTGSKVSTCYNSNNACKRFLEGIYDLERGKQIMKIHKGNYLSIMIDGATDTANIENEVVYIRYLAEGGPQNAFLGIQGVKHAHAAGVLEAVEACMEEAGLKDWKARLVGFGSDGAAVNLGSKSGVAARLKHEVEHLVSIHCIAHRLELGVVGAIRNNPKMANLQEMLVHLYDQYHYSPKAIRELYSIAEALEEKVLRPTTLRGARWLPYVHRATKIVCDSYPVLVAHFEDMASPERVPKPSAAVAGRAKKVLSFLLDHEHVIFMHFMCDVMDHLSDLSQSFQKDNLTVCQALHSQEMCFLELVKLKGNIGPEMTKVSNDLKKTGRYKGVTLKNQKSTTLLETRVEVIDSIIDHLEERLMDLQEDSVVALFGVLDPSNWPTSRDDLAAYGQEEYSKIIQHYRKLLERAGISSEVMQSNFARYKSYARKRTASTMSEIFLGILQAEDKKKDFQGLAHLMETYLILPVSTAGCERGFSTMKRIKSDHRSSLANAQLQKLMYLSIMGPNEDTFDANGAVESWWVTSKRKRRPTQSQSGQAAEKGAVVVLDEEEEEEEEEVDEFY